MNTETKLRLQAKRDEVAMSALAIQQMQAGRALEAWQNLAMASAFAAGLGNELPLSVVFHEVGL